MALKPWREVATPNPNVLEGTFQQSEFAADISEVQNGKADPEYQDPATFFQRTYITEGMGRLLVSVARRLNCEGGDPVIQLQTAFGGGKTHTMLAVYHLATRKCKLSELAGVPELLEQSEISDVPLARCVILDGTAIGPNEPRVRGGYEINTLWGDLAWQLGGEEAYQVVENADKSGTSPGKEILQKLLSDYGPCVILVDELVAYIRSFHESKLMKGGSYDSNLTFIQALTEAVKLVDNAMVLASLPESEAEVGSSRGRQVLTALEKLFGRVQAVWKPVATEESFEIVRRRLFAPINDAKAKDAEAVCSAFHETYITEGNKLPSETQEKSYRDRLGIAYPIHPELFDRLYEDWSTLDNFQRTRGVLKLMAKVIHRLWQNGNQDLMILPSSIPLDDSETRNELTYYLGVGWDPVVEKDIDGDRAETSKLEDEEPRFGEVIAGRRVARTVFLGSAPAAGGMTQGIRGLNKADVLLGCLQPNQSAGIYTDALSRLTDRLHYLGSDGDKSSDNTRYWFDTRANLRREMEDRKQRFKDKADAQPRMAAVLKNLTNASKICKSVHVFTPHSDVPDDSELRLVFLSPEYIYSREEHKVCFERVRSYLKNNGTKPRHKGNRLLFVAPDFSLINRFKEAVNTVLAWQSIADDIKNGKLNVDQFTTKSAAKELKQSEEVLIRVARDSYKWFLCPYMTDEKASEVKIDAVEINTGGVFGEEIDKVMQENEFVIATWSPIHLREQLQTLYWKQDTPYVSAMDFWEDTQKYIYLPRLVDSDVLDQTIQVGAGSEDFFGVAYGLSDDGYDGFKFADGNVRLDSTLLLIEPVAAAEYAVKLIPRPDNDDEDESDDTGQGSSGDSGTGEEQVVSKKPRNFFGSVDIPAESARMNMIQVAEEIIQVLGQDPEATIDISIEIKATFPEGVSDQTKRAASENANQLNFKLQEWE